MSLENLTGQHSSILLVFAIATFLAGVVRGYTGFGSSALIVSAVSLIVPVSTIVPVVLCLEIAASVQMVPRVVDKVDRSILRQLILGSLVSIPVGQYLLIHMDQSTARLTVNCFVLAFVAFIVSGRIPRGWRGHRFHLVTGIASGLAGGMVAMGGLVTSIMLLASGLRIDILRATLVAMLFATCSYALLSGLLNGLVTMQSLALALILLPPLILGIRIGHRRFDPARTAFYRRATLTLLSILAITGIGYSLHG